MSKKTKSAVHSKDDMAFMRSCADTIKRIGIDKVVTVLCFKLYKLENFLHGQKSAIRVVKGNCPAATKRVSKARPSRNAKNKACTKKVANPVARPAKKKQRPSVRHDKKAKLLRKGNSKSRKH